MSGAIWRGIKGQASSSRHQTFASSPCSYAVRMCAARFSGCLNGCAEEASGGASGASGPVTASRMLDWTEVGTRILHSLEMGSVMTVFYQKKSQRPERRTFQIRLDTRQIVWNRNPDKIEGESEYWHDKRFLGSVSGHRSRGPLNLWLLLLLPPCLNVPLTIETSWFLNAEYMPSKCSIYL